MAQRSTRIISDDALGGEPRIEGHRLGVLQIHQAVEAGDTTPSEFAARYDVDVAAVYRALAYYHENPNEMETVRQQRRRRIDAAKPRGLSPDDVE